MNNNNSTATLDRPRQDTLIDLFAGCGGSGGGLLDACAALNRKVHGHFVNHWDRAMDIHAANHPEHRHYKEDLFLLDPAAVLPADTYVSLLWASPSCVHFSLARGAACVSAQERSHAHSVTDWIAHLQPEGVIMENVPEFLGYGPTVQKRDARGELTWALRSKPVKIPPGSPLSRTKGETDDAWLSRLRTIDAYARYEVPDPSRKGEYFNAWLESVKALGYDADWRILRSADYGDPTIRRRLFLQLCRKDCGKRIVWPTPTHTKPDKDGNVPEGLKPWRTAREIIDWSAKGASVFARKKPLASNTFRRLAIGLVKYGLKEFLSSNKWRKDGNTRGEDLVQSEAFVVPKDQGWQGDYVRALDDPLGTVQTTAVDHVAQPMIDHLRGTGVATSVNEPLRTITAGARHEALAEAFMLSIDQTGGGRNHGTYSTDEPLRTIVTKANASCIEFELVSLEENYQAVCEAKGIDTSRAETFLGFLVAELKKNGKIDAKPWIYVYYSNGSEGSDIDAPLPTVRCKAGSAVCYPVIEFDGHKLRIDLFYRMLTSVELQRAMGFPDNMSWAGATQTEKIRAIGNSVSRGVSRALGLAWYGQEENISKYNE